MSPYESKRVGLYTYSGVVLVLGGLFALIDGIVAVSKSTFYAPNAVFVFSDLNTWGWIIFGLGVLGVIAGAAVLSGREWARWTGVVVAGLGAVGQLLFAQAYPLWSLVIIGVYFLAIYGLLAHRDEAAASAAVSRTHEEERRENVSDVTRRAA